MIDTLLLMEQEQSNKKMIQINTWMVSHMNQHDI